MSAIDPFRPLPSGPYRDTYDNQDVHARLVEIKGHVDHLKEENAALRAEKLDLQAQVAKKCLEIVPLKSLLGRLVDDLKHETACMPCSASSCSDCEVCTTQKDLTEAQAYLKGDKS